MTCSCCGEERTTDNLTALQCHPEVAICRGCIGWLREQSGVIDSTPVLPVRALDEAVAFYTAAGFEVRVHDRGGYAFVSYDDESTFDIGHEEGLENESNHAGCYLIVPDVDEWHARLASLDCSITPERDEDYGMREFALTDPSGNRVRFGRAVA